MPRTQILYHGGCPDGFGAAFAAWLKLGDEADYIPCNYGGPPPDMPEGAPVRILDFSFPRATLLAMKERHPNLVVVDHHKTAQADLDGLDFCIFDMEHSGATLAWAWFNGSDPGDAPRFLRYIEDRDLWRWRLEWSKEISAWLFSHPRDFATWKRLYDSFEVESPTSAGGVVRSLNRMNVQEGVAILRARDQFVESICEGVIWVEIANHIVPAANTSVLFSEVPTRLLELHPSAPFAASFRNLDGKQVWSLRSTDNRVDVSAVAKRFGGGGHRNAAGFTVGYGRAPLIPREG